MKERGKEKKRKGGKEWRSEGGKEEKREGGKERRREGGKEGIEHFLPSNRSGHFNKSYKIRRAVLRKKRQQPWFINQQQNSVIRPGRNKKTVKTYTTIQRIITFRRAQQTILYLMADKHAWTASGLTFDVNKTIDKNMVKQMWESYLKKNTKSTINRR